RIAGASRLPRVRRILVTGMSGSGKSTVLAELARRGFETVDTDEADWTRWSDDEDGYLWVEDRIAELLARDRETTLYLSGTVSNQGRFYAPSTQSSSSAHPPTCSYVGSRREPATTTASTPPSAT